MATCYCTASLREDGSCPFKCPQRLRAPHKARQNADRMLRQREKRSNAAPVSLAEARQSRGICKQCGSGSHVGLNAVCGHEALRIPRQHRRRGQELVRKERCSRCGNQGHESGACRKRGAR